VVLPLLLPQALAAAAGGDCTLQSCCVPMMVTNTHALDVIQVGLGLG
jgi:hypothetical protein